MTDFLGRELSIGDTVVALSHQRTSSTLYLGEIIKTTPTMLVLRTIRKHDEEDWRYGDIMRVSAYKTVKVDLRDTQHMKMNAQEGAK